MIRRIVLLTVSALMVCASGAWAAEMAYPEAPGPNPDHLITPPGESIYFNVRPDGQPFALQIDTHANITEYLNRHYYDFNWRGEDWAPYDNVSNVEKVARLMNTWRTYNQANQYNLWNGFNQYMERNSGYGP